MVSYWQNKSSVSKRPKFHFFRFIGVKMAGFWVHFHRITQNMSFVGGELEKQLKSLMKVVARPSVLKEAAKAYSLMSTDLNEKDNLLPLKVLMKRKMSYGFFSEIESPCAPLSKEKNRTSQKKLTFLAFLCNKLHANVTSYRGSKHNSNVNLMRKMVNFDDLKLHFIFLQIK